MKRSKKKQLKKKTAIPELLRNCGIYEAADDYELNNYISFGGFMYDVPIEKQIIINNTSTTSFINSICSFLKINPKPTFIISDYFLDNSGGLEGVSRSFQTNIDGKDYIIIRSYYQYKLLLFNMIAHELRHIWQNNNSLFLDLEHQGPDKLKLNDYNLQPDEVDANGFAMAYLMDKFHVVLFETDWSQFVRQTTINKAEEIGREYFGPNFKI